MAGLLDYSRKTVSFVELSQKTKQHQYDSSIFAYVDDSLCGPIVNAVIKRVLTSFVDPKHCIKRLFRSRRQTEEQLLPYPTE